MDAAKIEEALRLVDRVGRGPLVHGMYRRTDSQYAAFPADPNDRPMDDAKTFTLDPPLIQPETP